MIETYKKSGMGLDRGLSPTFDLLVDRYFEIADSHNPDGAICRVRKGQTARLSMHIHGDHSGCTLGVVDRKTRVAL